jgi:hypothetical protein
MDKFLDFGFGPLLEKEVIRYTEAEEFYLRSGGF